MTDLHDDLDTLRDAAASGDPDALHRHGAALLGALRMDEAFDAFSRAAAQGHAASLVERGRMLMHGVGTRADIGAAIAAFEQAESLGQPLASYHLALIALGDRALPRDARVSDRLLAAVQAGHPPALRAAAIHFGRKPDLGDQALALRLLDHAAGRGDPLAAQLLAERVRRGEGCPAQPEAATQLWARLAQGGFTPLPDIVAVPAAPKRPSPPSTLALDEVMDPPAGIVVTPAPYVAYVDGLLSVDDCRLLVATAQAVNGGAAGAGDGVTIDPLLEDVALRLLQLRMAVAAGRTLAEAAPLRITRALPPMAGSRRIVAFAAAPAGAPPLQAGDASIDARAGRAVVTEAQLRISPAGDAAPWLAVLDFDASTPRAF